MATELNIQELVLPLERIQSQPFVISSSPDNVNEVETISPSSAFPTSSTHSGYLDTRTTVDSLWTRKYFMVNNNYLLCAETHLSVKLEDTLYLEGSTVISNADTSFQLFVENKTIYFKTNSLHSSRKWTNEINKASKLKIKDLYRFLHVLGESGMTKVVAAQHKITNQQSAIKIVDKRICDKRSLKTEIKILKKLDNQCIVKLHDVIETEKYLYIAMEECKGGELFDKIIELDCINEHDSCLIMHQIALGVKYMHSVGIIHRDLKPENILCVEPDSIRKVKIADFGISKMLNETRNEVKQSEEHDELYTMNAMQLMCSVSYTAPEILSNKPYDCRADYWSIGVILFILLCGYPPFYDESDERNDEVIMNSIINDELVFDEEDWCHVSNETKDLLKGLLCKDPSKRKTCDDILKLVWKVTITESFKKAKKKFKSFNFRQKLQKSFSEFPQKTYNNGLEDDVFEANKKKIQNMLKRQSRSMQNTLSPQDSNSKSTDTKLSLYDFQSSEMCMEDEYEDSDNGIQENEVNENL